jgi:hypothetical protein
MGDDRERELRRQFPDDAEYERAKRFSSATIFSRFGEASMRAHASSQSTGRPGPQIG